VDTAAAYVRVRGCWRSSCTCATASSTALSDSSVLTTVEQCVCAVREKIFRRRFFDLCTCSNLLSCANYLAVVSVASETKSSLCRLLFLFRS
jgi:hypothetical protein